MKKYGIGANNLTKNQPMSFVKHDNIVGFLDDFNLRIQHLPDCLEYVTLTPTEATTYILVWIDLNYTFIEENNGQISTNFEKRDEIYNKIKSAMEHEKDFSILKIKKVISKFIVNYAFECYKIEFLA